jgi:hypothetical protein
MRVNTVVCDKCLSVLDGEEKENYIFFKTDSAQELNFHPICLSQMSALELINCLCIITYYHNAENQTNTDIHYRTVDNPLFKIPDGETF